jgi:hypothetical protein
LLPITLDEVPVTPVEAIIIRRQMRRWYEKQPTGFLFVKGRKKRPGQRLHRRQMCGGVSALEFLSSDKEPHEWRVQYRRWKRDRGGMSLFLSDHVMRRLIVWAAAESLWPRPGRVLDTG